MIKLKTNVRKYFLLTVILFSAVYHLQAQSIWTELNEMPMPIANNAVTHGIVGDTTCVFSFGGIDTTKTYSGINQKAMRYNTISEEWTFIPDLPDTLGKIASAASTVNNIIYITGGYHVFPGPPFELSSDKIHRYDPEENVYLSDGAPMPHAIDDQVQAVWRDSLIFMVTGWSDTGNVPYVQIYNPYTDSWQEGTSTPSNTLYQSFGASGVIIGDTIYYNGGAAGSSFNSVDFLRRGIINPDDPTEITWDQLEDSPGAKGYRMAAVDINDQAFWIGGSGITYNYNGIAYNGSGGVPPLYRILSYNTNSSVWYEELDQPYGVMDLRGAAKIDENKFIICGGMLEEQQVSNKAFLIEIDVNVGLEELSHNEAILFPNPAISGEQVSVILDDIASRSIVRYEVYDSVAKMISSQIVNRASSDLTLNTKGWVPGIYFVKFFDEKRASYTARIVIEK